MSRLNEFKMCYSKTSDQFNFLQFCLLIQLYLKPFRKSIKGQTNYRFISSLIDFSIHFLFCETGNTRFNNIAQKSLPKYITAYKQEFTVKTTIKTQKKQKKYVCLVSMFSMYAACLFIRSAMDTGIRCRKTHF